MIFGWLKGNQQKAKKSALASRILEMSETEFAEFVYLTLQNDIPATRTMCVVAYANLCPLIAAYISIAKERGETPLGVENFIEITLAKLDVTNDEIVSRRLTWFFLARRMG